MDLLKKETTTRLNQLPISYVASLLGLNLPKHGSTHCPFPDHDDANPSFEIKKNQIRWRCYGCDRFGGSIDFIKTYKNIDFLDAKKWILHVTGSRISPEKLPAPIPKAKQANRHQSSGNKKVDQEIYEFLLRLCPLSNDAEEYLRSRAISGSTAKLFNIGSVTEPNAIKEALINQFGFPRVKKSGLLTKRSESASRSKLLFPKKTLIFPFIKNGKIVYLQGRHYGKIQNIKWLNPSGVAKEIFNREIIGNKKIDKIAICEGVFDALSSHELDIPAVALMGLSRPFARDELSALKNKEIVMLLDWDQPGEKAAANLQEYLSRQGIYSVRKNRPYEDVKDLNEFLVRVKYENRTR